MAKVRVYELARELGVESKEIVAKLKDMGEFVRSASSTVEPPVIKKLKEAFPAPAAGAGEAPAKKTAKKAAKKTAKRPATKAAKRPAGKAAKRARKSPRA